MPCLLANQRLVIYFLNIGMVFYVKNHFQFGLFGKHFRYHQKAPQIKTFLLDFVFRFDEYFQNLSRLFKTDNLPLYDRLLDIIRVARKLIRRAVVWNPHGCDLVHFRLFIFTSLYSCYVFKNIHCSIYSQISFSVQSTCLISTTNRYYICAYIVCINQIKCTRKTQTHFGLIDITYIYLQYTYLCVILSVYYLFIIATINFLRIFLDNSRSYLLIEKAIILDIVKWERNKKFNDKIKIIIIYLSVSLGEQFRFKSHSDFRQEKFLSS